MKTAYMLCILIPVLLATACTTTLRAGKDGRDFMLGSGLEADQKMLCGSGDLQRVLDATALPRAFKEAFAQSLCSETRSAERTKQLYNTLTADRQNDLLQAFKQQGYTVYATCG